MKKLATLIVVLLVVHLGLLFIRPKSAETAPSPDALRIGVVFDVETVVSWDHTKLGGGY